MSMKNGNTTELQSGRWNRVNPAANILFSIVAAAMALFTLLPLILVIIISFSSEQSVVEKGYSFFPTSWSLDAYRYLWKSIDYIGHSFLLSLVVMIVGTLLSLWLISTMAYALSRSKFKLRKFYTILILIPMFFGGGLVASYVVNTQLLGLRNSVLALILPSACSSWYIFVMRTYFQNNIPSDIYDAAELDGTGAFLTFFRIVIPLSGPILVTIGLFQAFSYWNSWYYAMLYISPNNKELFPLLGAEVFFRLNSDYFEDEKGLTIPEAMKFEDLEPMLAMYKEDHPDQYPLHMGQSGLSGMFQVHERIVSNYLVIPYSKAGTEDGTTIIPVWEDEEYMDMLRCLHRWYEAGYINPDAATTTDLPYSLHNPVRSGTAWTGYKGWSNPETVGFNVKLSRYIGPNMSRATQQGSLIAINAAASEENAKACLKYMELLYTDREFRDLLAYGIEGEHFRYYEGTVIRTSKGADDYLMDTFVTGPAVSASVVSAGENNLADPDQWKKVYEAYADAKVSDTQGFSYDGEETESVRAALYAIWENNYHELVTGTSDPDVIMPEMAELMYAAGLQDLIDDAQSQLDLYLESIK